MPRFASSPSLVASTAALAAACLTPTVAFADDRVASIAAKGTIAPDVPVFGGLALGLAAALLALVIEVRARRAASRNV